MYFSRVYPSVRVCASFSFLQIISHFSIRSHLPTHNSISSCQEHVTIIEFEFLICFRFCCWFYLTFHRVFALNTSCGHTNCLFLSHSNPPCPTSSHISSSSSDLILNLALYLELAPQNSANYSDIGVQAYLVITRITKIRIVFAITTRCSQLLVIMVDVTHVGESSLRFFPSQSQERKVFYSPPPTHLLYIWFTAAQTFYS